MVMGNPAAGQQPNSKMALLPLPEGVSVQTLTVFIALAALLLNAVAWIAQRQQLHGRETQRALLIRDITELKREAAKYNTPSTFARSAKCQRQVNAKEKQLAQLETSAGSSAGDQWTASVQQATRVVKIGGAALCTLMLYGKPLAYVPTELLLPVQRKLLAMPHGSDFSTYGAISVLPWMVVCDRASSMLVKAVLPPVRVRLPPVGPSQAIGSGVAEGEVEESKKDL